MRFSHAAYWMTAIVVVLLYYMHKITTKIVTILLLVRCKFVVSVVKSRDNFNVNSVIKTVEGVKKTKN